MKGFTLIELIVVTFVMSIIAAAGMPVIKDVIESHRVTSTVETMKSIAAAADVARKLPGGDVYTNAPTSDIAALLDAYNVNSLGLSATPMQTHWDTNYEVTTTGQYATVRASIPLRNINPFETVSNSNGASTTVLVSHTPQGRNRPIVNGSLYNKKHLYLESNDE